MHGTDGTFLEDQLKNLVVFKMDWDFNRLAGRILFKERARGFLIGGEVHKVLAFDDGGSTATGARISRNGTEN